MNLVEISSYSIVEINCLGFHLPCMAIALLVVPPVEGEDESRVEASRISLPSRATIAKDQKESDHHKLESPPLDNLTGR